MSFFGRYFGGGGLGSSGPPPQIINITPNDNVVPGGQGAFSAFFDRARYTPIEFDLTGLHGAHVTITVKFENRDETYEALDADGVWLWPFDIEPDNAIGPLGVEPVHVRLLPRDGWPPGEADIKVAAARSAVPA